MARVLIATVGTGTRAEVDITQPLVKSVRGSNPERVVFLVTDASEPHARDVSQRVRLAEGSWQMVRLDDMDDLNHVFRVAVREIRRLATEGYSESDVEVDYTTGTKSMSAGAAMAAVATGCGALKYVGGRREQSLVISGAERIHTMEPGAVTAFMELAQAHSLLIDLRFDAALNFCSKVNPWLLEDERKDEPKDLEVVIQGYDRWDKFDHIGALELLRRVDFDKPWNLPYRLPREMLERLRQLGGARKAGSITEDMLADLANNAWRRWYEGKYDDAVARLYRLVEMLAQRALQQPPFRIKTGNVDSTLVPEHCREKLEAKRDSRDGKVKIGCADSYALLLDLGSPLGIAYHENGELGALLGRRNTSILGHGLTPVEKETCESLFVAALTLVQLAVSDFQSRCRDLQFPWLRGKTDPTPELLASAEVHNC